MVGVCGVVMVCCLFSVCARVDGLSGPTFKCGAVVGLGICTGGRLCRRHPILWLDMVLLGRIAFNLNQIEHGSKTDKPLGMLRISCNQVNLIARDTPWGACRQRALIQVKAVELLP